MKRLLLIATALLALTSAASAVEMPKELRGVWCLDIDRGVYTREGVCTVRNGFLIGVRGFDIPNNGYCTVLKMRQFGKHAYRSKFRCRDERLIPLTQVLLYVVGASIPPGSRFCVDCLA